MTGYKSTNTGRIFKHAKLADESQQKISEQDLKQLFIDGIGGQVIQINSKVKDKSPKKTTDVEKTEPKKINETNIV